MFSGEQSALNTAIERWKTEKASDDDLNLIREAWLSGHIVIQSSGRIFGIDGESKIDGQSSQGLIHKPSGAVTQIFIQVSNEQSAKAFLAQLQPQNQSKLQTDKDRQRVQIILEGDFKEFNRTRQEDLKSVLAALLSVDQDTIKILYAMEGSIKLIIEMPEHAARRLIEMAELNDSRLRELGITCIGTLDLKEQKTQGVTEALAWEGMNVFAELALDEALPAKAILGKSVTLQAIANKYTKQGDLAEALAPYERVLAIDEQAFGPDHPNVANDVNNLGLVLRDLGDLAGARGAFEIALVIDERAWGPEHPNVARSVNNLGLVLQDLGDLAGARAAFERALAIDKRVFGPDHPNVARDVNNLGLVMRDLGDLAGAQAAFERALAIDERAFRPDHQNIGRDVNNLGSVLLVLGDLAGARTAFKRALEIFEKFLPADHPNIRIVRRNLETVEREIKNLK